MAQHGKGGQFWQTSVYEDDRKRALEDRSKFTSAELTTLDVAFPSGGGRTDPDNYEIKQQSFKPKGEIRTRKKFDMRDLPILGGDGVIRTFDDVSLTGFELIMPAVRFDWGKRTTSVQVLVL